MYFHSKRLLQKAAVFLIDTLFLLHFNVKRLSNNGVACKPSQLVFAVLLFCCFFSPSPLGCCLITYLTFSQGEKWTALFWIKLRTALGLVVLFDSAAACFRDAVRAHTVRGFGRVLSVLWLSGKTCTCFQFYCAFHIHVRPVFSSVMEQGDNAGIIPSRLLSPSINNAVVVWVKAEGTNKQRKFAIVFALCIFKDEAALNLLIKHLAVCQS